MLPLRDKIRPLPEALEGLATLALNISWSWNREARALFRSIDEDLWHQARHNPIRLQRGGRRDHRARPVLTRADSNDLAWVEVSVGN
jgi:glucan phosphorylase